MLKHSKSKNFSAWYTEVITKSEFADYSPVSGCIVFRPMAYAVWEKIVQEVDKRFKEIGIKNTYFPLLIPEHLLEKETEHFKGFTPEVAWVTHTGKSKLDERLAIRPTSEVIMYESYKKWIRSWRDLPLRINQWNNVVRWEFKHPTPFLRSREFLWNEGHNVYATEQEVKSDRDKILNIYNEVQTKFMALPGILGQKSDKEKFAGALITYTIEHIMPDGKAIQGPDYHDDGQNFSKVFDITFLDKSKKRRYAYQSTYAITTRQIGVLIATHGDDKGLVLPPNIAPTHIVIVPIYSTKDKSKVMSEAKKLKAKLKEFSVELDDREEYSPGWKFNEWELKGVPLRIEIGPKDIAMKKVVIVRRDTGEKKRAFMAKINIEAKKALDEIQSNLFNRAKKFLEKHITKVKDYDEFKKALKKGGFISACWCGNRKCEDTIKEETGAKITNIPFKAKMFCKFCLYCGKKAKYIANFAKSY